MIDARPYDDFQAMAVLSDLDPYDALEASLMRGQAVNHLAVFADWRSIQGARVLSLVLTLDQKHGGTPFAVLGLMNTGQAGVAQAALLSRSHSRFQRPLAQAAARIRRQMPVFCIENGIHRVEARCWAGHPTASVFLQRIGFHPEVDMAGFGANGGEVFRQFAWISPNITKGTADVLDQNN